MNKKELHEHHQLSLELSLALIFSLFFHIIVIVYVLKNHTHSTPFKPDKMPQKKPETTTTTIETEWVETHTKPTHPVYFQQKDEDDIPEQPQQLQQHIAEKQSPLPEQKISEPESKKEDTELAQHANIIQQTPIPATAAPQKAYSTSTKSVNTTTHPSSKTLPSLSQLTHSMMNHLQKGNHSVSMLGKKNGTPTDEQLKYERYLERLNQCLENSFIINAEKQPLYTPSDSSITLYLALNKDGSIRHLKLVKSCGNHHIDYFVMHVLREASSSFPPVPHYLPHDPFAIHYVIGTKPKNFFTKQ